MSFLYRFGAVSGFLAGLCLAIPGAVEAFTGETLVTSIVIGLSPALATPLLVALYSGQRASGERGGGGAAGFAVNLLGLGLFGGAAFALNIVVFPLGIEADLAPVSRITVGVASLVFVVGVVMFGIALLRARRYPRVPVWLYLLGFPAFTVAAALPDSVVGSALHVVVGVSLGWLAVALASSKRSASEGQPWTPAESARA